MSIVEEGLRRRAVGSTLMNAESSRSHLIARISVTMPEGRHYLKAARMTFVDLAGSGTEKNNTRATSVAHMLAAERIQRSGVTGTGLKEAQSINK
jgi:hypothetical protein